MICNRDEAIDKLLAALKAAEPPAAMEARITARLQEPATVSRSPIGWRENFTGSATAGAWWRGALSGAMAATVAIGLVLVAQHRLQPEPKLEVKSAVAGNALVPASRQEANSIRASASPPCARPALIRANKLATVPTVLSLRAENLKTSRPAPIQPLTAEERGLVHLARTADPKQLASLNQETQAKAKGEEETEFQKFFTPPPPPPPPKVGDENQ